MSRSVTILGSTGSVGRQTLDVIAHHGREAFPVIALTAGANVDMLIQQARAFKPKFVAIADETHLPRLKEALADMPSVAVAGGKASVIEAAALDAEITVAGIVGVAGLVPTMTAIKRGRTVAFANKETMVAAGKIMMEAVAAAGTTLLPVDSEHNALFQALHGQDAAALKRVVLTASGGPFRDWSRERMAKATPEAACAHPVWAMGPKISVDSATLMNKALEVIEAHHLFGLPSSKIDVLVHPQSVVHGMVEYADGSFLAQLGPADMRTPITVCLGWPKRIETSGARLDLATLSRLDFAVPDLVRFPALKLVRQVLASDYAADAIAFNAANEVAVDAFLKRSIAFTDILDNVERMLNDGPRPAINTLEETLLHDGEVRMRMADTLKQAA